MRGIRGSMAVCATAVLWLPGTWAAGQVIPEHAAITEYNGPSTCVACHQAEALDMHGSVHYQWSGQTPYVSSISGMAGKANRSFNSYCGSAETSRHVACYSCHVGYGKTPQSVATTEQLNNIDCLTCHQVNYARKAAPPAGLVTMTDYLGVARTWQLPIEAADGSFSFMPDTSKMTISPLEAARTVHRPTRATCLSCHAFAAGTDGGKRGDISTACLSPGVALDVHMSPQGANLSCQDCHRFQNHHVLGRGVDLPQSDMADRLTCTTGGCHSSTPHASSRLNTHTERIACQTCHIPTYGKGVQTEIRRDWQTPHWAQGLFSGQGGYKPTEIHGMNLTPTYAWFDGTSKVIVRGQVPALNADGQYELALPNGTVKSPGAKIHPMKEHLSNSARHMATGQLVPHATSVYFQTGDFNQAVAAGMAWTGLAGEWSLVDVHAWQSLNHAVEPSDNALDCGQCHASYATAPTRMDLPAMGYTLKGPASTICSQCHSYKSSKGFATNHSKHVTDKRRDCMWCHDFTRPERNLIRPPIPGDINGDGYVDAADLLYLVEAFGTTVGQPGYSVAADLSRNDAVDVADLLTLADNWAL